MIYDNNGVSIFIALLNFGSSIEARSPALHQFISLSKQPTMRRFMAWWLLGSALIALFLIINIFPHYSWENESFISDLIDDLRIMEQIDSVFERIGNLDFIANDTGQSRSRYFSPSDYYNYFLLSLCLMLYFGLQKYLIQRFIRDVPRYWLRWHGALLLATWLIASIAAIRHHAGYSIDLFVYVVERSTYTTTYHFGFELIVISLMLLPAVGVLQSYLFHRHIRHAWFVFFVYAALALYPIATEFFEMQTSCYCFAQYNDYHVILFLLLILGSGLIGIAQWSLSRAPIKHKRLNEASAELRST